MVRGANFYLIGDQLQEKIRNWLQQPDPSTNYNVAIRQRHDGTAAWFTKGSTFKEWKTTGSLLWVHGKRTHFSDLHFPHLLMIVCRTVFQRVQGKVLCGELLAKPARLVSSNFNQLQRH